MKFTKILLVSFTSILIPSLMTGCSEEISDGVRSGEFKPSLESHYLIVNPRSFKFDEWGFDYGKTDDWESDDWGDTQKGSIQSKAAWSFSGMPSWLYIDPQSGNSDTEFYVEADRNLSLSSREAVFYISTNNTTPKIQRTLSASQAGSEPYISLPYYSSNTITVEGKSDYLIINVDSNIPDLTATFSESWASVSYNYEASTVNIEIQANETNSTRNGTLTVSSTQYSKYKYLTISQLASGVTVLEEALLSYDADGGTQTRTIKSDLPWTAQTTISWIDFYPKSGGAGETPISITALPSYESTTRAGQIYFYFGDTEKKYIGVTQSGRYLTTTPKNITLSADENSSENFTIESNIGWEVKTCPEWLTLSPNKGNTGKSILTATAQKNNSLNSRSGTITIMDSQTGCITSSITATQNGLDFGDNTTLEFGWQASSLELTIPIPNKWTAAVSDGWISLSQYSGTGETTCDITVSRNDSPETRTGQIIFSSEGRNITVSIVQEGQYITINSTSGEIPAIGGSIELYVNTTVDIEPLIEYGDGTADWITYEKNTKFAYKLSIKFNPSINQRTANFILKPKNSDVKDELANGVIFSIKQSGRGLRVEPSKIYLFAKGGTTESYPIIADGTYSIEKPEEFVWFSLVHNNENNTYYLVATENKTDSTREGYIFVTLTNLPDSEDQKIIIDVIQNSIYDSEINYNDYDDDQIL